MPERINCVQPTGKSKNLVGKRWTRNVCRYVPCPTPAYKRLVYTQPARTPCTPLSTTHYRIPTEAQWPLMRIFHRTYNKQEQRIVI